jgi:hypothetical protein
MKKHQGGGVLILLLEIIALLIIFIGGYVYIRTNSVFLDEFVTGNGGVILVKSGDCGLTVNSHSPDSKVKFPLKIRGTIDNSSAKQSKCFWQMFEGQAGVAQTYFKDAGGEWKKLGESKPVMVDDWMSVSSIFNVSLNLNNEGIGLASGTQLKVVFTEENASGMPNPDTYELPLILDQANSTIVTKDEVPSASGELMSLVLYVQDKEIAKIRDCGVTKQTIYQVPKTSAVSDASLKILFSSELSKYGKYKSVSIVNGVAKVVLESENTPEGLPIGGLSSCESSHLMSVLKDTLTQYKTIKSVDLYSPKGKILF